MQRPAGFVLALVIGSAAAAIGPGGPATAHRRADRHGDPLPPTASSRLGTVRFRGPLSAGADPGSVIVMRDNRAVAVDVRSGAARSAFPSPVSRDFEVHAFLVEPSGRRVAYGSASHLEVLDTATGRCVFSRGFHPIQGMMSFADAPIRPIAFLNHGEVVVVQTTEAASVVSAWNCTTGKMVWEHGQNDPDDPTMTRVLGVAGEPPTVYLVVAQQDGGFIWMIDAVTGQFREEVELPAETDLEHLALSPDGRQVAFINDGGGIIRITLPDGVYLPVIAGDEGLMNCQLTYSRDSHRIAALSDSRILILDARTGSPIIRKNLRNTFYSMPAKIQFNSDDTLLIANLEHFDGWRMLDGRSGSEIRLPDHGPRGPVGQVVVSPDGTRVAACARSIGGDELPRLWESATGSLVRKLRTASLFGSPDGSECTSMAFTPDGKQLVGRMLDNRILVWDVASGRSRAIAVRSNNAGESIAMSPDGKTIALGPGYGDGNPEASDFSIRRFDLATGRELARFTSTQCPVSWIGYSPDGRWIALVNQNGDDSTGLILLDANTGQVRRTISGLVHAAGFVPFADALVYSTLEHVVLWDIASGTARLRLSVPRDDMVDLLAVSRCGRWLAGANNGAGTRRVYLWDLHAGVELPSVAGHDHVITALAWGPGGMLVTGSADTTALVHDVADRLGPRPVPLPRDQWPAAWDRLADDSITAHQTLERMLASEGDLVAFLAERLRPARPIHPAQVERLLTRLDAARFADRLAATRELEAMDSQIEPWLSTAAKAGPSVEARRRASQLVDRLQSPATHSDRVRELRCVEYLERRGDAASRSLLNDLARGDSAARLTQAAQRSLSRFPEH